MSKFAEEETFFIFSELNENPKLSRLFNEEMVSLREHIKFKHREINDLYAIAYEKAKKRIEDENV
jgi:hypothetical protein